MNYLLSTFTNLTEIEIIIWVNALLAGATFLITLKAKDNPQIPLFIASIFFAFAFALNGLNAYVAGWLFTSEALIPEWILGSLFLVCISNVLYSAFTKTFEPVKLEGKTVELHIERGNTEAEAVA